MRCISFKCCRLQTVVLRMSVVVGQQKKQGNQSKGQGSNPGKDEKLSVEHGDWVRVNLL